jgi:hypothetical protein
MDCAPNNGYYMIPVYDKGAYVLKVEPPKGWKFGKKNSSSKNSNEGTFCTIVSFLCTFLEK